jgi:hypothetical protein
MNVGRVSTMIVTALLFAVPIINADAEQVCQKTTLYTLTFHPQTEHVVLCHPTGKDLVKANDANILFNKGIVAAQHSSLTQCPNSDKSFCSGWDWEKKYG